jgi:hypothetical protein
MPAMTTRLSLAGLLALSSLAVPGTVVVPDAARRFVAAGTTPLAYEVADLNRDGREDAILVLGPTPTPEDDFAQSPRLLLILLRQPDGSLREAKRNQTVVYCRGCGGLNGDPFTGLDVGMGTFTVHNAGGDSLRWFLAYRFDYSRRDTTCQLVRVEEDTYQVDAAAPSVPMVFTPPKDYGRIDIADFDPDNWKGQGPK